MGGSPFDMGTETFGWGTPGQYDYGEKEIDDGRAERLARKAQQRAGWDSKRHDAPKQTRSRMAARARAPHPPAPRRRAR